MKKVGVITFHRAINYGAVLQAYALQHTIDLLGGKAEIIDYRCTHLEDNYSLRKRLNSTKSLHAYMAVLLKVGIPLLKKKRKFRHFVNQYLHLSKPYFSDTIKECENEYDLLITGSDQVWNYHHTGFDRTYFLDFVKDKQKKSSYAASFGFEQLDESYKETYRCLLQDYKKISVRENSGVDIVKDVLNNYSNVFTTIDPVFLLDAEQWMYKEVSEKEYILVYELMPSDTLMEIAIKFAKKYKKSIIRISGSVHRSRNNLVKEINSVHPEEFLGYIHDAEMIITNSFHGTAFSIIFNKELYVVPLEGDMATLNTRMINLLRLFDMNNRVCTEFTEIVRKSVNWDLCNEVLSQKKQEAKKYLKELMEVVDSE